ncbi:DedA family protein [Nigerium massiliense]|uniref:DedA family protein n=1 Tax=Nigerium massiliense TaxID=1522317 RepID=UPI000BE8BB2B|nr:DedA family protein [Nigerium massiliense]
MLDSWLSALPAAAVYLVVGLMVGAESLGVPLPGETAIVVAALITAQPNSSVSVTWVAVAAMAGAICGNSVGYAVGRRFGPRLLTFLGRRFPAHWSPDHVAYAEHLFGHYGMRTVFAARFTALLRMTAGPLAGTLKMPYWRFLLANASRAICWAGGITYLVHLLGTAAHRWISGASWVLLAVIVLAVLGFGRLAARAFQHGLKRFLAERAEA